MGAVSVILVLVFYLAGWFCKFLLLGILSFAISLFFMTRAGLATRTDLGGYITFQEAIKPTFLVCVIALVIGAIFNYILYTLIDPGLPEVARECAIAMTERMLDMMGAPEEAAEQALADAETRSYDVTLGSSLKNLAGGLIWSFVVAAIISLIIRKKDPQAV